MNTHPGLASLEPIANRLGFWAHFGEEMVWHWRAMSTIVVLLGLLVLCRLFLPPADRVRLRFPFITIIFYMVTLPVRAGLGWRGLEAEREYAAVIGTVVISLGITAVLGLVFFDLLGRRYSKVKILRDVATFVVGAIVLVVLLHRAGVNLLPLVTTSAVLTAVIGLAFQDTLGNVISGLAIQMESTLSPGDWVTVNELSGQVAEIRWRSVVLITRNDDMVVLPHSLLAKAVITNSSRPVGWQRRWVHFQVHYRHPPNEVEQAVLESVRGLPNVRHDDPAPDCILFKMEQDHAHYAVRYRLLDLRRDDATDGEVRKRIWYALRRRAIEIPYPSRNIFVTELTKEREAAKWQTECGRRRTSLKKVGLFAPLTDEEVTHLAEGLRVELFGKGEIVIRQGAPGDSLYLVRRGEVVIRVEGHDGKACDVAHLAENDFFGEMSLMTGEPRGATVEARGDVECYVIDRALFQEVLSRRETLVHEITHLLAERRAQTLEREAAIMGPGAVARGRADLLDRVKRFFGVHT